MIPTSTQFPMAFPLPHVPHPISGHPASQIPTQMVSPRSISSSPPKSPLEPRDASSPKDSTSDGLTKENGHNNNGSDLDKSSNDNDVEHRLSPNTSNNSTKSIHERPIEDLEEERVAKKPKIWSIADVATSSSSKPAQDIPQRSPPHSIHNDRVLHRPPFQPINLPHSLPPWMGAYGLPPHILAARQSAFTSQELSRSGHLMPPRIDPALLSRFNGGHMSIPPHQLNSRLEIHVPNPIHPSSLPSAITSQGK